MATLEDDLSKTYDEERLQMAAQAHEVELEEMHRGERLTRHSDLEGEYQRPESFFNWGEDDKRARQLAALADWGPREVRQFRKELQEIEDDGRYSEDHKEKLKAELAREYLEADAGHADRGGRLVKADFEIGRLRSSIEAEAEEFQPFDPPEAETAAYSAQREREIREALAAEEDAGKRLQRAQQLVDSGDPEAIRAVVNPPPGTAPLTEPNVQLLRKRALRNRYGDRPEDLDALRGLSDLAYRNVKEARNEIARMGGISIDE